MPTESEMRLGLGVVQMERDFLRALVGHLAPRLPIELRREAMEVVEEGARVIKPILRPKTQEEAAVLAAELETIYWTLRRLLLPPLCAVSKPNAAAEP